MHFSWRIYEADLGVLDLSLTDGERTKQLV